MHAAIYFNSETQPGILPEADCACEKQLHDVKNSDLRVFCMKNGYFMGNIMKNGYF